MHKRIEVTSRDQKLFAFEGSRRVFEFDCFLGDNKTPTRPGHFSIRWKDAKHVSTQYCRPMPYAMFFDQGRAIHGGVHVAIRHLAMRAGLGRLDNIIPESAKIGSHGCVNLKTEDAARLFDWAKEGTPVIVR